MKAPTRKTVRAAVLFPLLIAGGCREADAPAPRAGGGTAAEQSAEAACPYVGARPSYLPWLEEGEDVPEPQRAVQNGTSYVMWSTGGDDPSSQSSVVIRRSSEPRGGKGEPVDVSLEGADGYYYDGPGADGAVLWKTHSGSCGLITLTLSLPGYDGKTVREEILRVVESLET